ncbi:MAG: CoA transferase [Pseudomonadota bacterium]
MSQPLASLRVLDVSQVMAGPFCCRVLADLGADVIKVEPPAGDQARRAMEFRLKGEDSPGFYALNRNKRSIALDLKTESGLTVFKRLVAEADIMVENSVPGAAERLGIGYAAMSTINPGLIYASISGFGQDGPWARRPGFDLIAQAASGVMAAMGEPGGPPSKSSIPLGDLGAGLFSAVGILSAVIRRAGTGEGAYIDASLYEAAIGLSIWESAEFFATGQSPVPIGTQNRMSAPYQAVRARDRAFVLGAANERLWQRLCAVLERPDLADDPRFALNAARMKNRAALIAEIETTLATADADTWVERLLAAGVPAGPINTFEEAVTNEHAVARDQTIEMPHNVEGLIKALGFPFKMTGDAMSVRHPPPALAEHSADILDELGLSSERDALADAGAFGPSAK